MRSHFLFSICVVLAVGSLFAVTDQPYSRYETIISRQMFGPLPRDFDPSKMPSEVAKMTSAAEKELSEKQEQIKKSIRFMAINRMDDGAVMVGFADNADPKNPLTYYLKVGDSQNGWTVREADPETAVMTIVNKEDIEVTLKLGGDSATDAGAVSRGSSRTPSNGAAPSSANTLFGGRHVSRRERRRAEQEAERAANEKKAADERAERARKEEEAKAEREAEKAQHAAEQEQTRKQLAELREQLKQQREEKERLEKEREEKSSDQEDKKEEN